MISPTASHESEYLKSGSRILLTNSSYLQSILPLLACAISIIVILLQFATHVYRSRTSSAKFQPVPQLVDVDEDGVSYDDTESLSELTLQKTVSHARRSIVEANQPVGKVALVGVELLALLGLVAISICETVLTASHQHHKDLIPAFATLIVWTYITTLASVRFFTSATKWKISFSRLWNHTALLYGAQWLLGVWSFRTVLLQPTRQVERILVCTRFALSTLLLAIALTSRTGNRAVLLEYEGDIEPSREPIASPFSHATFSWVDSIVIKGYKTPLELADVWNVCLKDKAETVLTNFRQVSKTHGLAVRLVLHFKKMLLIQGAWCAMASVFMFLPTLLLKAILEYLEDPETTPASAAWLYVILLFVTGAVQAVGDGQGLWIGRKVCIQLRAVIVGELYSKTLRRKAAASTETELGKDDPVVEEPSTKSTGFWRKKHKKSDSKSSTINAKEQSDAQASNGTIINLMSIDSFKVAEICSYLHFLWAAVPVQLVMAVVLLYNILGFSSLAGIGLMILVLPLQMYIARSFTKAQKRIMAATDKRIHATNEVLQNIRIIKYFAWEQRFQATVDEKRCVELSAIWKKYVLWSLAATVFSAVPVVITFVSFLIYTVVEKRPLVPSIAFPALSMFSLLRIPLDQLADMVAHVQESRVSIDRVEQYLREEETEKYWQLRHGRQSSTQTSRIGLEQATLTWGSPQAGKANDSFRLINVDVDFQIGKLNVISGPTGSGKTSLLMALLGEMKLVSGQVYIPGGSVRQDLHPDPETGLTDSVAYCAQQAWLVNATLKDNILFASPYDAQRYRAVLSVCALERDLEVLEAGDQTLVGEKGVSVSGGQKQRISLARAIYSNSRHLLLDDCLSAVDSHTAKHIFEQALTGTLMQKRTCILVSHNVALTVHEASYVVVLNNGKIVAKGDPIKVIESGALGEEILASRPGSAVPSRVHSTLEREIQRLDETEFLKVANGDVSVPEGTIGNPQSAVHDKTYADPRMEAKATGRIKTATITMYLKAMGPWWYWIVAGSAFIATQVGQVATNVWIRQWANAYHTSSVTGYRHAFYSFVSYTMTQMRGSQDVALPVLYSSHSHSFETPHHKVDVSYYLGVYALLGSIFVLICLSRELVLFRGSLRASTRLHERLLQSILRAKFRFFDSTPLGQMTNRFSKDVQSIDQEVAPVAIGMVHSAVSVVAIVILISVITPGFLVPGFFIAIIYVATGLFYIRSSRDLKRIEAVQRSPLFQHFGETLTGVVTIRAYGDESRFMQDSQGKVNTHNRPFIYLWATNRWLAFRMDIAGALVSFFSGLFVVVNAGKIDAGAAGLALSYAITFTQNVLWLIRLYAANEQNMNSVERIQEYIDVPQEAAARVPDTAPAANWPSRGAVEFVGYGTRYRSDLGLVLKKLTFKINASEKIGVVGRTGAGKSSAALALFRGLEAEEGKILIDNVDIGLIGLQDLREAITIVPQDPTLFTGTLRSNLDPFELFTDEEVFTALRKVQLISKHEYPLDTSTPDPSSRASTLVGIKDSAQADHSPNGTLASEGSLDRTETNTKDNKNVFLNLMAPIAESGSNLSQGQRQLLCLARALLKAPKVLVMDEATASIDYATDTRIQNTLRELKNHTLITIAHRLQTIIDYDKILVLEKGELIEYAHPWELIQKEGGSFRGMCETSGHFDMLFELAKKAWAERQ